MLPSNENRLLTITVTVHTPAWVSQQFHSRLEMPFLTKSFCHIKQTKKGKPERIISDKLVEDENVLTKWLRGVGEREPCICYWKRHWRMLCEGFLRGLRLLMVPSLLVLIRRETCTLMVIFSTHKQLASIGYLAVCMFRGRTKWKTGFEDIHLYYWNHMEIKILQRDFTT